jgi:hypothetical protein
VRIAVQWTYLYQAVNSSGYTIDFLLSPKRDAVAAKHFPHLALWRSRPIRPEGDQRGRTPNLSSGHSRAERKPDQSLF